MNCLEFRRTALSEPGNRAHDYLSHRGECDDCARYADSVGVLDTKIADALRVPVPEDLANRIKLRQVLQDEQVSRRLRPWQYALAASVFLVVSLGGMLGYQVYAANQYVSRLSVAAVEHTRISQEGNHFVAAHVDPAKQQQRLQQVLAAFGGQVMGDAVAKLGTIVHVQVCALTNIQGPAAHVLIQGEAGFITLYYVGGNKLKNRATFAEAGYHGLLVPVGQGNLAILGDPAESLQPVADKMERAVVWTI